MNRRLPLLIAGALLLQGVATSSAAGDPTPPEASNVARIVVLDSSHAAALARPQERGRALARVRAEQRQFVRDARDAGIDLEVDHRLEHLVNGLGVRVPEDQVDQLGTLPAVTRVAEPTTFAVPEPPAAVDVAEIERAMTRDGDAPTGRDVVTVTNLTGVPQAHDRGFTGAGVTVGIIDSGIAYDHGAFGGGGFPNERVVGGYDFADDDADPYDERFGSAAGHGTHVAGILLGNDAHMTGVAPEARLRAYRVFGRGQATEEDVLAALDRAAADGVDVVNMSLGQTGGRSSDVLALAVDQLTTSGVTSVVSIGNGFAGPFNAGVPAVADTAIGVGSTFSTRLPWLAFTVDDGSEVPIPFHTASRSPVAPSSGSFPVTGVTTGCEPLEPGSLEGQVALFAFRSGDFTCRGMDQARVVEAAGAVAGIHYSPPIDPERFPGICCGDPVDIPLVLIRGVDADRLLAAEAPTITWGAYAGLNIDSRLAGLMDYSSSWGPGNELEFKPDIAAPGGDIFSTLPAALGHYGVASGTSMAAPHVAGIVALLLQANASLTPDQIRTTLQNSATPLSFTGAPERGAQPVAQQGAGRIDAIAALDLVEGRHPTASPSELPLGDVEGRLTVRRISVQNPTDQAVIYDVIHRGAISAAPPYTSFWEPDETTATVTFDTGRIVVPPHDHESVTVQIREPADAAPGTLVGGWVELRPANAGLGVIRVPYVGASGDFDAVSAVNPTFTDINQTLDNPALRPRRFTFGQSEPITVDLTDGITGNDRAWVMVSHGFPMLERLQLQVLDARGRVVATAYDEAWVARNSGAGTGLDFLSWDAHLDDGTVASAGTYRLRLVFDKALGDHDGASPTEHWTSPEVTLVS